MQAEVDKYVVLMRTADAHASENLRTRLYEDVSFFGDAERYRLANSMAHRFVRMLERNYVAARRWPEMRTMLRRFFSSNQEEKLRIAQA
jgi:hypothetical protein